MSLAILRLLQHSRAMVTNNARRRKISSFQLRDSFINFFTSNNHVHVPSSSVVPNREEGAYFINAGMNQFKSIFLGEAHLPRSLERSKAATTHQKCIRVGGLHDDLDDVGNDGTHHTFFEMLGSWSFGAYSKELACRMALQLLQEYGILVERLYFTYFSDPQSAIPSDLETQEIWLSLGIAPERILPFPSRHNFWAMGGMGPCGTCTEIHYDRVGGNRDARHLINSTTDSSCVELWNLVFINYDRKADGQLVVLPSQFIDTGLGLERLTTIMQDKKTSYDTDLFQSLMRRISEMSTVSGGRGVLYGGQFGSSPEARIDCSYRILADHSRMASIAIADGLRPSRRGIEHRLRTVIQRALRQAINVLKIKPSGHILSSLSEEVEATLGGAYPELVANRSFIRDTLYKEECRYFRHLSLAKNAFQQFFSMHNLSRGQIISGNDIRDLYCGKYSGTLESSSSNSGQSSPGSVRRPRRSGGQSQSVPLELIKDLAAEHNLGLDLDGFNNYLLTEKKKSADDVKRSADYVKLRTSWCDILKQKSIARTRDNDKYLSQSTSSHELVPSQVVAMFNHDIPSSSDSESHESRGVTGDRAISSHASDLGRRGDPCTCNGRPGQRPNFHRRFSIVLNRTSFYSKSSQQEPSIGYLATSTGDMKDVFRVDSVVSRDGYVFHEGHFLCREGAQDEDEEANLRVGETVYPKVDQVHQEGCSRAHSASHILSASLRYFLPHINIKSQNTSPDRFTFTFSVDSHTTGATQSSSSGGNLTVDHLALVEDFAQHIISSSLPLFTAILPYQDALNVPNIIIGQDNQMEVSSTVGLSEGSPAAAAAMVRVVHIGGSEHESILPSPNGRPVTSTEICSGTHVSNTIEIGKVAIIKLSNANQGIKSLTVLTGTNATKAIEKADELESIYRECLNQPDVENFVGKGIDEANSQLQPVLPGDRQSPLSKLKALRKQLKHGQLVIPYVRRHRLISNLERLEEALETPDSSYDDGHRQESHPR